MAEHVCVWAITGHENARCIDPTCDGFLDGVCMEARLNATERLSYSSAIQASRGQGLRGYVVKSLLAYADILEGKDETQRTNTA